MINKLPLQELEDVLDGHQTLMLTIPAKLQRNLEQLLQQEIQPMQPSRCPIQLRKYVYNIAIIIICSDEPTLKVLSHCISTWTKAGFPLFGDAKIQLHGIRLYPTDESSPEAYNFGFVYVDERVMMCKSTSFISIKFYFK